MFVDPFQNVRDVGRRVSMIITRRHATAPWWSVNAHSPSENITCQRVLTRMKGQLAKLDLLILDELGYVPASKLGAELLFDVISTAYERTSLIVTVTGRVKFGHCWAG